MGAPAKTTTERPLDLSKWRKVPNLMIGVGLALAVLGLVLNVRQFAFSWLVAFMFCLSFCLGALFLVLAHHLFDAGWSVPIRRFCEHIASLLFPEMLVFFLPIAVLAPGYIFSWMQADPHADHALHSKLPLFTKPGFYLVAALSFGLWAVLSRGLRKWSIAQDTTGAAECTHKMRLYSYWGMFVFAVTLTFAAIMWMKALQYQWFSTMYGVYYFAGSVWTTLATVYLITMTLTRTKVLTPVLHKHQFYYIGSLLFAFTVFYAYITFSQYFIIWNANMPEETFWYIQRENSSWWDLGLVLIFGHFFLPFLTLLRIDAKESFVLMTPLCVWAWLMHYVDMSFNISPIIHPEGFPLQWAWLDLGCIALIMGVLIKRFLARYAEAAPYPLKDPRLAEAMGLQHQPCGPISGGDLDEVDRYRNGEAHSSGGK